MGTRLIELLLAACSESEGPQVHSWLACTWSARRVVGLEGYGTVGAGSIVEGQIDEIKLHLTLVPYMGEAGS